MAPVPALMKIMLLRRAGFQPNKQQFGTGAEAREGNKQNKLCDYGIGKTVVSRKDD